MSLRVEPLSTQTPATEGPKPLFTGPWIRIFQSWVTLLNTLGLYAGERTGDNQYPLQLPSVLFADLPAAPVVGTLIMVTDSTTAVWGAAIAGTGANVVLALWSGAAWTVVGI